MKKLLFIIILTACTAAGCGAATELTKTLWGSSTRALENARVDAASGTFGCTYDQCYEAVEKLTIGTTVDDEEQPAKFSAFIKNKKKRHIIVMNVPEAVDTTEVGIFFLILDQNRVKIEVSSLSSNAKRKVASIVFDELNQTYQTVN